MGDDPRQSNDIPQRIHQSINPSQVSPNPTAQQPIVLSIHGIRTTGAWQKSINPILAEAGFVHYPYDYGFFFVLKMLFPFLRGRRVGAFRKFYESVHEKASGVPISLIAHSFGTYIAAKTMVNYAQVSFDQIIFCGSIVQRDYDWAGIITRGQARRVLHDYGSKDIWVRLAEWVITDAGPSGQAGFIDPPPNHVIQQVHPNFRHSDHFYPSNFRQRWVPFLRGEALAMIQPVRPPRFNWKPWLLGGVILLVFCLMIVLKIPRVAKPTQPIQPEVKVSSIKKRLTLYETFQMDFLYRQNNKSESSRPGYSVKSDIIHTFTNSDGHVSKVTSEYIIHKEFITNSMFLVIYTPPSQYTYNIAVKISDDYKTILDHDARGITATSKDLGDSATLDSKNIHFTRMIYIYHEDYLTLEQLGSLENLYRTKNLSVQFRDRDYPVIRQLRESN